MNEVLEPLARYAEVFNGKTPSKADQRSNGHPVLKVRDVDEEGRFRGLGASFVDLQFAEAFRKKWSTAGDTLILNAAHNSEYVGSKTFHVDEDSSGLLVTGEWMIVRPNPEALHPSYARYWLNGVDARRRIRDMVKGIHLYPKDVARLPILIPPLTEQKRIAAILDQADELRRKRKQAIAKAEDLRAALMDSVLASSSVPCQLSSLFVDMKMGPFGSLLHKSDYVAGGVPLINPMHITGRKIVADPAFSVSASMAATLRAYTLAVDDIIIGRRGEMGRTALVRPQHAGFLCGTGSMRLTVDRKMALPAFMVDFLSHPRMVRELENAASGVTMLNLSSQTFSKIKVRFPKIEHQVRYVEMKDYLESRSDTLAQSSRELDKLFISLQHRAFRGEL